MSQEYIKIREVFSKIDLSDKEKAIANSLIALHSGCFSKNDVIFLCSNCASLADVYAKTDIIKILGESENIFYNDWIALNNIPTAKQTIVLNFINILMKYPNLNDKEKNSSQSGYGIIEEYDLGFMIKRLAKELGRERPLCNIVNNIW